MQKRTIVALPGDGIGKVVLEETIRVLDQAGFHAGYMEGDIGWEFWKKEGNTAKRQTCRGPISILSTANPRTGA